jgi:hypothetical protein
MDINQAKLKRVIAHIEDDGVVNPATIAGLLKAQPKNVTFLRSYVEEASKQIGHAAALAEFDRAVSLGETEAPAPKAEAPIVTAPEPASAPTPKAEATPAPAAPQPNESRAAVLLNADGTLVNLTLVRQTPTRLVFEVAKPTREVKIFLRGEVVTVDLLNLKPVTVQGVTFGIADLELIAKAADV